MPSPRLSLCAVLATAAGIALLSEAASAQDRTFELKLSHWVPPSHPLQKAMEDWGASIEKASNGTIKYIPGNTNNSGNHTTYHRGQVAAKLKRFGIQQAETDLVFWAMELVPQAK